MKQETNNDENHAIYHNDSGPITLADEGKNIVEPWDGGDLFNDQGFVLRARSKTGEDVHLWCFMYQQRGRESIIDGDICQLLVVAPKLSEQEKAFMHPDVWTVNEGQGLEDYFKPGTLTSEETKDKVIWKVENVQFIATPPYWHVVGEKAGVKIDLRFEQYNPAFWHLGTFDKVKAQGIAGYIVHCRTNGTLVLDGKTLEFENQFGLHERILQKGYVPDRTGHMSGRGLHWMHGFSDGFSWYLIRGDVGKGMGTAMINVGDEQIHSQDASACGVEEAQNWHDPESRTISAFRWRVWVRTSRGVLESRINAYGRQNYTWVRRGGTIIVTQYCADAETEFRFNDGKVVSSKQLISIEHMRTFYRQISSLQNPGREDHIFP